MTATYINFPLKTLALLVVFLLSVSLYPFFTCNINGPVWVTAKHIGGGEERFAKDAGFHLKSPFEKWELESREPREMIGGVAFEDDTGRPLCIGYRVKYSTTLSGTYKDTSFFIEQFESAVQSTAKSFYNRLDEFEVQMNFRRLIAEEIMKHPPAPNHFEIITLDIVYL